ncbi:MAG TPA: choloylglycine hydrolase family protein [Microthrixaceae bacterium]|nr:choloylglycine hydrolase family protein [Microthrixaceae bacterium]
MCTSFRVTATDGAIVVGRTMEFPTDMATKVTVLPVGFTATSVAPGDGSLDPAGHEVPADGLTWTSRYGLVGMDVFGRPQSLTDGTNTEGLYAGLLYMPGFCDYTPAEGKDPSTLLSIIDLVAFVLGTCATVAEVKQVMAGVTVWPFVYGPFGFAPPAHLVLHDATGASAVVEWRDGEMVVFDNPIGVACNSPHFDWHLTNLRNYVGLSVTNPASVTIDDVQLAVVSQGPGMFGLPGDASSPSRFVRAVAYTASLRPVPSGDELEHTALHVLNDFDITKGFVRAGADPSGDDHTIWSTVTNLTARRYVVRTYDNPIPQAIALHDLDFSRGVTQSPLPAGGFAAFDPSDPTASAAAAGDGGASDAAPMGDLVAAGRA